MVDKGSEYHYLFNQTRRSLYPIRLPPNPREQRTPAEMSASAGICVFDWRLKYLFISNQILSRLFPENPGKPSSFDPRQ